VYLFWSMYSSDRMKTLIRIVKDYDNIVCIDCQMHFLNIYFKRKGILFLFFHHFNELPAKKLTVMALAEIERL